MSDDDDLMRRLGDAIDPEVPPLDPARAARIRALAEANPTGATSPGRRSLLTFGAVAAGGIAAGVAAGVTGAALLTDDVAPGPPLETASVRTSGTITATATMIDHTWGLEVLLDASGLAAGDAYTMSFEARDGTVVDAGGFIGVSGLMRCRNNGPLLRAETARWFVTAPDGTEVIAAELD